MKFTVGKKLGAAFEAILALMLITALFSRNRAGVIRKNEETVTTLSVPTIKAIAWLERDMNQAQSNGGQVILAGTDATRRASAMKLFTDNWDAIDRDVEELTRLSSRWSLQQNRDRLKNVSEQLPNLRRAQEGMSSPPPPIRSTVTFRPSPPERRK